MTSLGELALWAALPIALWGSAMAGLAVRWRRGDLAASAERSAAAVAVLLALAAAGLAAAFLADRFEYVLVDAGSSLELPAYLKLAAVWSGSRGAVLVAALVLAASASVAASLHRRECPDLLAGALAGLLGVLALALVLLNFVVSPFERAAFARLEGAGLPAVLQSPWAALHSPLVALGFAAFAVGAGFTVSALAGNGAGDRWLPPARRWILAGWTFLTAALAAGMRWAYEAPGWDGPWTWDPAENAVLVPWLAATAFLFAAAVQRRSGFPRAWTLALAGVPFLLAVASAYLATSGLFPSDRFPAPEPVVARSLLALLAVAAVPTGGALFGGGEAHRSDPIPWRPLSREGALLTGHLALLGFAFVVLTGTLLPLVGGALSGPPIEAGPPWFTVTALPLGLTALALLAVVPTLAWGRARPGLLFRRLAWPAVVAAAAGTGAVLAGLGDSWAAGTFAVAVFVLASTGAESWRRVRGRPGRARETPGKGNPRPGAGRPGWGPAAVSLGAALSAVGLAAGSAEVDVRRTLDPGETLEIRSPLGRSFVLTYEGLSTLRVPNAWEWSALFSVRRNGELRPPLAAGLLEVLVPRERGRRAGIRGEGLEDLHIVFEELEGAVDPGAPPDSERATFRVRLRPLPGAIWGGGLLAVLGGLLWLLPPRLREPPVRDDGEAPGAGRGGGDSPPGAEGP